MARVHSHIGIHKRTIQIATKVDGIGGANILDNGIEHIESGKFPFRASLAQLESVFCRRIDHGWRTYRSNVVFQLS